MVSNRGVKDDRRDRIGRATGATGAIMAATGATRPRLSTEMDRGRPVKLNGV